MLIALKTLTIETQGAHEEWCWASVTAGVSQFLENRPYEMDKVVQTVTGCAGNGDPMCEIPWPLSGALAAVGHLDQSIDQPVTYPIIQNALITQKHPVPIGITFSTDMGTILHYCVIAGCSDDGNNELLLLNPALPPPCQYSLSYDDLLQGFVLGALWTNSFFVK